MQAIILAGGRGTRLRPYTTILPKPLMPIGDYAILEVVLRQLKEAGFREVLVAVGYLGELIEAFLGDGSKWGLEIRYSREDKALGTAGPIALFDGLEDDFLVMNGDILTNVKFDELYLAHKSKGRLATVSTYAKEVKIDLGVIEVDADDRIAQYIEKPTLFYQVSMGIYIFNRRVLDYIPKGEHLDLPSLIQNIVDDREPVDTALFEGFWLDIGRSEDYEMAIEQFDKLKGEFLKSP
jgi:NDP-mannose synthase